MSSPFKVGERYLWENISGLTLFIFLDTEMSYLILCSSPDVTKKNDPPTFCKESHKLEESKSVLNTRTAGAN